HPEALQDTRDPRAGGDAQEIVFQREIKAGRAGVALAAGASTKLIVNAAGLVALGAENVQPADGNHFIVLGVGELLMALENLVPLRRGHGKFLALVIEERDAFLKARLIF